MNYALYFAPDAALLLLLLRMIFVGADRSAWREFLFLGAWFFYSLLSLLSFFPAWGHLLPWIAAGPLAVHAAQQFPRARRCASAPLLTSITATVLLIASALGAEAVARWGSGSAGPSASARIALLGALFALALAAVLLVSSFFVRPLRPLRCGIGVYLFSFYGGALLGAPVALLSILSTACWLSVACLIAPRPDLLFNVEKLAVVGGPWPVAGDSATLKPCPPAISRAGNFVTRASGAKR
jgi:hypothetical protein